MWVAPDQSQMEGRWFWGEYQEFGVDVHMERASDGPMLIGADRSSLKSGTQDTIRLYGDRLPAGDCGVHQQDDRMVHRLSAQRIPLPQGQ